MNKLFGGLIAGVIIGAGAMFVTNSIFLAPPKVQAAGVVEYQPPSPGATAVPPEGYYVLSRIYVQGLKHDALGKAVTVSGQLDAIADSDGFHNFPMLRKPEVQFSKPSR